MSAESPKKVTAVKAKAKKSTSKPSSNLPTYQEMIKEAILVRKERGGSSRQAIQKYITDTYGKCTKHCLNMALKKGVGSTSIIQVKGVGASGSFKLAAKDKKPATPKVKKTAVKKTASSKKSTPKKTATKKKATTPPKKKVTKRKSTGGSAKKSSTKKVTKKIGKKPVAKKTPKKTAQKKKPATKKTAKK